MGPNPEMTLAHHANFRYEPWMTNIPGLRCPSDPGNGLPSQGRTNYAYCYGDSPHQSHEGARNANGTDRASEAVRAAQRGMFVIRKATKFRDVLDGLSNTIAGGEIMSDLGDNDKRTAIGYEATNIDGRRLTDRAPSNLCAIIDPERPQFWGDGAKVISSAERRRGYKWAWAAPASSGMTTIWPPNERICVGSNNVRSAAIAPPSSRHQGDVHVLMGDGAVKFITDSIEAGNQQSTRVALQSSVGTAQPPGSQSPYGLWGALGTRAAKEVIGQEF